MIEPFSEHKAEKHESSGSILPLLRLVSIHDRPFKFEYIKDGKILQHENKDHESYTTCNCALAIALRRNMDSAKLSGLDPNMSYEDWIKIMNSKDIDFLQQHGEEIKNRLFCSDHKDFIDMSTDEQIEHLNFMKRAITLLSIRENRMTKIVGEKISKASAEEKERIRQLDRQYKPKPVITEDTPKKKPAKEINVFSPFANEEEYTLYLRGMNEEAGEILYSEEKIQQMVIKKKQGRKA